MNKMIEFPNREALDAALAVHIASLLHADLEQRGRASLAVSGGSTPKGMFTQLAAQELDWSKVAVTLVDERWVDTNSPDSNERLLRETLLQGPASSARFYGLTTRHNDAEEALAEVTARLQNIAMPFTCVVLGMGGDGHTASWFPLAGNLAELLDRNGEALLACSDPGTAPHQRITLTLPPVIQAGAIILHITGDEKRQVLAQAAARKYPVASITEQENLPTTTWWAP